MEYTKGFLEEIKTASRIQSAFYGYFYSIFKGPLKADFIGVTEQFLPHFKELAGFVNSEDMKRAVETMEKYVSEEKNAGNQKEFLDEMNQQFTGLYLLGSSSVPSCASVYLSNEKLLKREPWEKVCLVYGARGFRPPEDFNEPEDHIALENLYLQKLSELAFKVAETGQTEKIEQILKEHKDFINCHLLPWAEEFAELTIKNARKEASLYGAAATIMTEFLKYDAGLTEELLEGGPLD